MLFDAKVLSKFFVIVTPPLILIVIVSFSIRFDYLISLAILLITLLTLLVMSKLIFGTIPNDGEMKDLGYESNKIHY